MSGIKDTNTVDIIGKSKEGNADIIIVEENPWTGSEDQIKLLKKKINSYVNFFVQGKLGQMYTELKGKPTNIVLMSLFELDPITESVLSEVKEGLKKHGLDFQFHLMKNK